jgi:hypothetical protein
MTIGFIPHKTMIKQKSPAAPMHRINGMSNYRDVIGRGGLILLG